jgi:hypothetical protein
MPVEVTSSGGPLTKRVRRTARINDIEAVLSVLNSLSDSVALCDLVQYWGEHCRNALKDDGIVADEHEILDAVEALGFKHPDAQWYEAEIFHDSKMIERIGQNGDIRTGFGLALKLGEKIKEYKIRHCDELLEMAFRVTEGGANGADTVHGLPEAREERRAQIRAAVDAHNLGPGQRGRGKALRAVGKQFNITERQVRAILRRSK